MKIITLFLFAICLSGMAHAALPLYTVTDLGLNSVGAINNHGQITGVSDSQGVIWDNGNLTHFQGVYYSGFQSFPIDINDNGQASVNSAYQGYRWENGTYTDLGHLPNLSGGGAAVTARGINAAGYIVGSSIVADGTHAFLWSGGMQDICQRGYSGGAVAINDSNQVLGYGCGMGNTWIWENGHYTATNINMGASDLNNKGQIAGQFRGETGGQAAIWENGIITQLTTTGGESHALNEHGQVVGMFQGRHDTSAFIWDSQNGLIDLSDLIDPASGIYFHSAVDINDNGQIIVNGRVTLDGSTRGTSFLLTPTSVPIPSAAWLLGSGLLGLIGMARRKTA